MTVKELFDFVTDPTVNESNMDEYLEKAMLVTSNREEFTEKEKVDDEVFKHSYIPFTMDEVIDIERDFRRAKQGEPLIYTTLHGLKTDLSQPATMPTLLNGDKIVPEQEPISELNDQEEESSTEEETSDDEDEDDETGSENSSDEDPDQSVNDSQNGKYYRPRDESPNSRKVTLLKNLK